MDSKLITLCICLVLAVGIAEAQRSARWGAYKRRFGKTYADRSEEQVRKAIMAESEKQVREHNAKHAEERGFTMAINHMSDWTPEECAQLNGLRVPEPMLANSPEAQSFVDKILNDEAPVPDSVDWRKVPGRVAKVKQQGNCGSCWAFATTGVLEGQQAVLANQSSSQQTLTELSEQDLIDCSTRNFGCGGGFMLWALNDIHKLGGIQDEHSYPYKAWESDCHFNKQLSVMTDKAGAFLPKDDEEALKKTIARFGPVAVAMVATEDLKHYSSGVYSNPECNGKALNHGVLAVGYGTDSKLGDYWIIKNSWSSEWGDNGYFKIARNKNNLCGIAAYPTIPIF